MTKVAKHSVDSTRDSTAESAQLPHPDSLDATLVFLEALLEEAERATKLVRVAKPSSSSRCIR